MANTGSTRGRAGSRGRCGAVTRVDLVTVFLAAMLCSASYCLGIWHNSRGAADSSLLGPTVALASCGDDDETLDFEAHHSAEGARLSVSSSSSSMVDGTTSTRRALSGAALPGDAGYGSAFTRRTSRGRWAGLVGGGRLRFTDAGAVRA